MTLHSVPPALQTPLDFEQARDWLAHRLDTVHAPLSGDFDTGIETTPAAVLVPLVMREQGVSILLTKRTENLAKHPGQISFPGGRIEYEETPEMAALRETEEETGLAPDFVTTVGRLAHYVTITGFRVVPVVGLVRPGFELKLAEQEVAAAFEVPLSFVLNLQNYQQHPYQVTNKRGFYLSLNWQGHFIWGATAGMLMTLFKTLSDKVELRAEPPAF
ncbi:NUDIX hydrolase [Parachitinimonas caeni]|uniref:CoA pyrophosphatase n=1 Tax=Parachitinimonas caeni TaxID=3031301 RepID=A0ABT7DUB0_9NEIS|nr:CoA pyrophosphatase [Parachitinimonas caeni]MDK2123661.1 CoA pyrophosphatase [Parachitinimonas caeni]